MLDSSAAGCVWAHMASTNIAAIWLEDFKNSLHSWQPRLQVSTAIIIHGCLDNVIMACSLLNTSHTVLT